MLLPECWGNNGKDEKQGREDDSDNCKTVRSRTQGRLALGTDGDLTGAAGLDRARA